MVRDFSEEARQALFSTIDQIQGEQWNCVTDWFGDRWYDFQDLIGTLDISNHMDNISSYHKKVLDKNNASKDQITKIFEAVHAVDQRYAVRLTACHNRAEGLKQLFQETAAVIAPANGMFTAETITTKLDQLHKEFEAQDKILKEISNDGLDSQELEDVDPDHLQRVLERLGSILIALCPDVTIGGRREIPLGPDTVFYYEVKAKVDGNVNVNLDLVVEDQQLKLQGGSAETDGPLSSEGSMDKDGNVEISVGTDNSQVSVNTDGSVGYSAKVKHGNDTYEVNLKISSNKISIEKSVTTEVEGGSVTSTIGIEKTNNNPDWQPITVPVEEPVTVYIPSFEFDWETLVATALTVVVICAGVYLVVQTGGAVLLVCVV